MLSSDDVRNMVISVEINACYVRTTGEIEVGSREVEPLTVDASDLDLIDIDMCMTFPRAVRHRGSFWCPLEVLRLDADVSRQSHRVRSIRK